MNSLSAPLALTWEVTWACNLRCKHCLSSSGLKSKDELTTEESLDLVDQLADMNVFVLYLGGGEPFIRKDIVSILRYADDNGIATAVSTNGSYVDEALASKLSQIEKLRIQISIDGSNEQSNDIVRGPGSFRRAMEAVEVLKRHGVPFFISTVYNRHNSHQLDEMYHLAMFYNVKLRIQRFRPSGRGEEYWDFMKLQRNQLVDLNNWLHSHEDVLTSDSFFFLNALGGGDSDNLPGFNICSAAKYICLVAPNGDVFPCPWIQTHAFRAGNIRENSLREIWKGSNILNEFRTLELAECSSCKAYQACQGGCRATAIHIMKGMGKRDAECMMVPNFG